MEIKETQKKVYRCAWRWKIVLSVSQSRKRVFWV